MNEDNIQDQFMDLLGSEEEWEEPEDLFETVPEGYQVVGECDEYSRAWLIIFCRFKHDLATMQSNYNDTKNVVSSEDLGELNQQLRLAQLRMETVHANLVQSLREDFPELLYCEEIVACSGWRVAYKPTLNICQKQANGDLISILKEEVLGKN